MAAKFPPLGMSLDDALAKVTSTPAAAINLENQIGTLRPGAWGDAVVVDLERGAFPLVDSAGVTRTGDRRLVPKLVVRQGAIYQSGLPIDAPQPHPHAGHHH